MTKKINAAYVLVAPAMILTVAVILIPEICSLVLSFTDYSLGAETHFTGLDNYREIAADPLFITALIRNLVFVFFAVLLQMILGLYVSLLLARKFPFQKIWLALILSPIAITESVAAVIWKYLLDYNIGPVNYILETMGFGRYMWFSSFSLALPTLIVVYVWQSMPNVILFLYPARITFPQTLYEAASIDGASAWSCFRYITFPLLRPAISVALVFRMMIAFRAFGIIWNLTRGGPVRKTEILSIYLYREGFKYWRFGMAASVGWIILLITMLIAFFQVKKMYEDMFRE